MTRALWFAAACWIVSGVSVGLMFATLPGTGQCVMESARELVR